MGDWYKVTAGDPGYKGRLHFKVDWTGTTKKVTVTETTEPAQKSNPSAKMWLWLNDAVGLYETSANIFEITYDVDTNWGFLVRSSNTTWDGGTKWGGDGKSIVMGQPYNLNNSTASDITFGGQSIYYYAAFGNGSMPDLNYGPADKASESPAFQDLAASADKWIGLGVDGFRLDAVMWIYNDSTDPNQSFLEQWYERCNTAYKAAGHTDDIFMVGEAWKGHSAEKQYYEGLPSCFEFDYFANGDDCVLRQALKGNAGGYVKTVSDMIKDHQNVRSDAVTSFFLTNHDNDRAGELLDKDPKKEKQAAAFLLTTPGKPFIYQGEELGYYGNKGGGDAYVRTPILWAWDQELTQCAKKGADNKLDTGMLTEKMSVKYQETDAASLLNFYKTWSRLRNTYPAFTDGTMTAGPGNGGTVASWYLTGTDGSKFLVIHYTGSDENGKKIDLSDDTSHPVALLGNGTLADKPGSTKKTLKLYPSSSVVFKL